MKIAICDDLENDRNMLKQFIDLYSKEESSSFNVMEFQNGEELLETLKFKKCDLIFLDIYMNGQKGIDIARIIKELYDNIIIIFTTASSEFAVESYSLNVEGYIVKPFEYEIFKKTFNKYCKKFKDSSSYIVLEEKKLLKKIFLKDITFIEIYSRQCVIHTKGQNIDTKIKINDIKDILVKNSFYKISRNFIINFKAVEEIADSYFVLIDKTKIPIPCRARTKCVEAYSEYLWKE